MLAFSPGLLTILNATFTKVGWANALRTALGSDRKIVCARDPDAAAISPVTTGIKFLEASLSGELEITAGNITGYGGVHTVTKSLAADLAAGKSVLRITGGGHWMEGTLGLPGSAADFKFSSNPTGIGGLGFSSAAGAKSPRLLNSGTGFFAPALDANAPFSVVIENWSSGSAVVAGTILLNQRDENFVFDDPQLAESMGDIRITKSAQSVVIGDIEVGAIAFGMNANVNTGAGAVHQVLIGFKPTEANWPNYPTLAGYVSGQSDTFPPPFKAVIKKQDGSILFTHEMRDGLPINSPELSQVDKANKAIRPLLNCGQMLPWSSSTAKLNTYANQYFPGMEADVLSPYSCRFKTATNQAYPFVSFRDNCNSVGHWFAMPKWAIAGNVTAVAEDEVLDPYLYPINDEYAPIGNLTYGVVRGTGWGYEPGASAGHDHYTGPGGVRIDRSTIATPIATYFTNKNYIHPRNNTPIVEMVDAWNLAYFNIPYHYLRDVKTFETFPFQEVIEGVWGNAKTYYGGLDSYVSGGPAKSVPLFAISNGATSYPSKPFNGAFVDKNNRMPWNGAALDSLHNYSCPGWVGLMFNSPMHVYAQLQRFNQGIMCQLGSIPANTNPEGHFLTRGHAWRWLHLAFGWKLSSKHALGMDRAMIESRFKIELETIYDMIVKPVDIDNSQLPYHVAMRNLGVATYFSNNIWWLKSQGLTYYMAHVLQLMKQFGLWSVMRNKSVKCDTALRFLIKCLDRYTVDWVLDTGGRKDVYVTPTIAGANDQNNPVFPANWAEWAAVNAPVDGLQDWVTNADGSARGEQDVAQHFRYQYVCMRRDYFPEIPCERTNGIALACAKYKGFYDVVALRVAATETANASGFERRKADWAYRWAPLGVIKPAPQLGAE